MQVHKYQSSVSLRHTILLNALTPLSKMRPVTSGRYLVKGWLNRGALSCLFGPSNAGKSFFALDMAVHVSAGLPWFGHRVADEAGPAVYICAKGASLFGNRVEALRKVKPEVVSRAEAGGMTILQAPVDLCRSDDASEIITLIEETMDAPPGLIIIDTLARSMGDGDENSGPDMTAFVNACGQIQAATNAHVMVIHHTGKNDGKGPRGHSSLHAAVDSEIELKEIAVAVRAEASKQRDMASHQPVYFALRNIEIGFDEDGDPVTSAVIVDAEPNEGKGALVENERKQAEAKGRAVAALRLLPSTLFTVEDARKILVAENIVRRSKSTNAAKSERVITRRILETLEKEGLLTQPTRGKFCKVTGGGNNAE